MAKQSLRLMRAEQEHAEVRLACLHLNIGSSKIVKRKEENLQLAAAMAVFAVMFCLSLLPNVTSGVAGTCSRHCTLSDLFRRGKQGRVGHSKVQRNRSRSGSCRLCLSNASNCWGTGQPQVTDWRVAGADYISQALLHCPTNFCSWPRKQRVQPSN